MVGFGDHLDQGSQFSIDIEQINQVVDNGGMLIGRHRLRFTSNDRDPFRIRRTRQIADRRGIRDRRSPQAHAQPAHFNFSHRIAWGVSASP
jgi:hypothetical protein